MCAVDRITSASSFSEAMLSDNDYLYCTVTHPPSSAPLIPSDYLIHHCIRHFSLFKLHLYFFVSIYLLISFFHYALVVTEFPFTLGINKVFISCLHLCLCLIVRILVYAQRNKHVSDTDFLHL